MQRPDDRLPSRGWKFEAYEERLALCAEPVADFWIDYNLFEDAAQTPANDTEPSSAFVLPLAAEGHGWTQVAAARDDFGLRGSRQTVAIIDSGIAWDHVALGGGLGKAYRVVGGWDFAENDANPYDDGPGGFHGTHVAGIVGASDSRYPGVAPGADLVGLRVFDDQGNGYFTWVEQALAWVHNNRNAFENPITTVNLSLGTDWNARTLPAWASLEDELRQLAADGIFISVAAGNSFLAYNAPGLSYPAVSQYVTPVASVDASGNLSRFSQRDSRVLAAPGERIMSTLPDHFYGGDGNKNDWGATSGTSMAAPYVAGASVLVREAMQNLGFTQITQGTIYDLFRNTADTVFDAATNASYKRLNLQRALETLVGADDFGATAATASSIGSLQTTMHVSGTIGRLSDSDFFQFTAARTGTATLTLSGPEHLAAAWKQVGQGRLEGNKLTLDVVAGQTYTVGVAGGGATIGKFQVDLALQVTQPGTPPTPEPPAPPTTPQPPTTPPPPSSGLVSIVGDAATITGTSGSDTFEWRSGSIVVNGVSYSLAGVTTVRIAASGGQDSLTINGTSAAETAVLRPGSVDFSGGGRRVTADQIEQIRIVGGASDRALLYDSLGNDNLEATPRSVGLTGTGFANSVEGFGAVSAVASDGGNDVARLYDSTASDTLTGGPTSVTLRGSGFKNEARGFEQVIAYSTAGGNDRATLRDSQGADQLDADPASAWLRGPGYSIRAEGFESLLVVATPGSGDVARLAGSAGRDTFVVLGGQRLLTAGSAQIRTEGFAQARFDGRGGSDALEFYTSSESSTLRGRDDAGAIADALFATEFTSVESVLASVRQSHRLSEDLAAADFFYRRIGRR
jgi:subtilisin family serine protease